MAQQTKMTITLSPVETPVGSREPFGKVAQEVLFFDVLEGATEATTPPQRVPYADAGQDTVAVLDYTTGRRSGIDIQEYNGYAPVRGSDSLSVVVYRQEIAYDTQGNIYPLSQYIPIATDVKRFHIRDYNVTNNRFYRYAIYPSDENMALSKVEGIVKTAWNGWSLTELHPVDSSMKKFSVSAEDVWVFALNVETGDQTQNLARNEQQTLGQFPRYSQGKANYITGHVSALLGSQCVPVSYLLNSKGQMTREGGYQEILLYSDKISSNDKVDMLQAWRKVVYSSNPKLLKDRKGQSFLVTVTDSTNKPMDYVSSQPDVISFNWHQVGSTDGIQIIDTSLGGGYR